MEQKLVRKSILASIMISIGCVAYISCSSIIVGSFLFSFGLLTICYFNINLYTGVAGNLYFHLKNKDKIKVLSILYIWIFNIVSMVVISFLFKFTLSQEKIEIISNIASKKLSQNFFEILLFSFFCGIIIYIVVTIRKPIYIIIGIMIFLICGYEHSIADIFYIIINKNLFEVIFESIAFILLVSFGNLIGANLFPILLD